jgi:hypothetical protein
MNAVAMAGGDLCNLHNLKIVLGCLPTARGRMLSTLYSYDHG